MHFIIDCREAMEEDCTYFPIYEGIVVAKAIARVERETGLSIVKLREGLGVSKTTLYRWRTGHPLVNENISHRIFVQLEAILGTYIPDSLK